MNVTTWNMPCTALLNFGNKWLIVLFKAHRAQFVFISTREFRMQALMNTCAILDPDKMETLKAAFYSESLSLQPIEGKYGFLWAKTTQRVERMLRKSYLLLLLSWIREHCCEYSSFLMVIIRFDIPCDWLLRLSNLLSIGTCTPNQWNKIKDCETNYGLSPQCFGVAGLGKSLSMLPNQVQEFL